MEANNIIAAPHLNDVETTYKVWRTKYDGSINSFYSFMTTPSAERSDFIASLHKRPCFKGSVMIPVL